MAPLALRTRDLRTDVDPAFGYTIVEAADHHAPSSPAAAASSQPNTAPTLKSAREASSQQGARLVNGSALPRAERAQKAAPKDPAADSAMAGGRPVLARSASDWGQRQTGDKIVLQSDNHSGADQEWKIRHGFESQLLSEEYNNILNSNFLMYFTAPVHETGGKPKEERERFQLQEWRMRDRLKTVSAALFMCLNIGVDPPDVIKTSPYAKLECWHDPTGTHSTPGHAPLNSIGKNLQKQYEALSMRTRYRLCLDPTVEETRKYCMSLRKTARNERVLFHYNGHGVPRPTPSGEIWVFNKGYTQYIPVSLYDLQAWLLAPTIMVYDCSSAGLVVQNYLKFAEKHHIENIEAKRRDPELELQDFTDCIQLAACREDESLPTNPDLPADVFTCALTTPIEMAVRFYLLQNPLPNTVALKDAIDIPGKIAERRTPVGELNWIFTAITDTIAWNSLPKPLFKKLFRQDLMVAALFRNFLLAQRIMRVYHCHPRCHPPIPETHDHPLWRSWDLAVELILHQLPDLLAADRGEKYYDYQHSTFFQDQLTAFDVYLSTDAVDQKPPEQLPIVLQVLLSQVHRLRALVLLSKFLDMGPWAVNLALSIGIFPYVLKLLQSQAVELKPVMVFIWARILAVDQSCQQDLLKDNGYQYFINLLSPQTGIPVQNVSEHRAMCAFIIAMFCKDFPQGQNVSCSPELMETCLTHLNETDHSPGLRQYSCLCISMMWVDYPQNKWLGLRHNAIERLCELKTDSAQEVRAAMLYTLTTFLGIPGVTPQIAWIEECIAATVLHMTNDGNVMVRKELIVFFSTFIARYLDRFCVTAYEQLLEERENLPSLGIGNQPAQSQEDTNGAYEPSVSRGTTFAAVWKQVLVLSVDPHAEVAENACVVVDYVLTSLIDSPLADHARGVMEEIARHRRQPAAPRPSRVNNHVATQAAAQPQTPAKHDGYLTLSLRRTASVAASLKNLAFGTASQESTPAALPKSRTFNEKDMARSTSYHGPAKVPQPKGFKPRNKQESPKIPLKSTYFSWAIQYFLEPQMKAPEADEPGSMEYNKRLWRRNRNDRIMAETQPQKEIAGANRWDQAKGFFDNGTQPLKMCFHQFEDHLVVTDDRDVVSVWDWKHQARLSRFSNQNPVGSKITEVRLINEDDQALLMTGASDGVIRIFRHYEDQDNVQVVSAFRALTDLVPSNKNAGLVFDWQQGRGDILVAGDVRVIKVWRAGPEKVDQSIPARSGSCVTALTSDQVEGNIVVGSFGDGKVRVYDRRMSPQDSLVKVWKEHTQWITNVHLQRGGQRELLSACRSGEVKLWDIRMTKSVKTIRASRDSLRTLSVHEHAPVFVVGSERHNVKLFNTSGRFLSSFEPYSSFLHQNRSAPIAATAFHPHRMMVAGAAYSDAHVNIYACSETKRDSGFGDGKLGDGR